MNESKPVAAPFYSKDQLEYLADQHTAAFSRYDGKEDPGFSAWKFAAHYLGKTVRFEWLSNNGFILGLSSFTAGTSIRLPRSVTSIFFAVCVRVRIGRSIRRLTK